MNTTDYLNWMTTMPLGNHPYDYKGTDRVITSHDRSRKKKHVGKNNGCCTIMRYRVDGVIIRQHTACDFILTNEGTRTAYLIEFKGSKIAEGAVQLMTTADDLKSELEHYKALKFRIIASRCKTHQLEDIAVKKLRRRYRKADQVVIEEQKFEEDI